MIDPELSPNNTPSSIKPKRMNKIPALTVFILLLAVVGVFAYIIIESGNRRFAKDKDVKSKPYVVNDQGAKYIVSGKPSSGIIPAKASTSLPEPAQEPVKEEEVETAPSIQPSQKRIVDAQPPRQKSPLEEELARIRQSKLKRLQMAATSPAKVSGANTSSSGKATSLNNQPIIGNGSNVDLNKIKSLIGQAAGTTPDDQNRQREKKEFYDKILPSTAYLTQTRTAPLSPLEIKAGTIIPGVMISGINSDLPGMIKAQVSQNVYDTATGGYLLIPQGSQLIGIYDNMVAYGQNRVLVSWSRIIFPDASTLELMGMPGTDQGGYAGLGDQVDNHYFRIFGSALLIAAITGGYEYVQDSNNNNDDESVGNTMAQSVARELASVSTAMMRRNINIAPTIKIRPGKLLNIMVNKDIIFPSTY